MSQDKFFEACSRELLEQQGYDREVLVAMSRAFDLPLEILAAWISQEDVFEEELSDIYDAYAVVKDLEHPFYSALYKNLVWDSRYASAVPPSVIQNLGLVQFKESFGALGQCRDSYRIAL
jgi:hypothetical protein